MEITLVDIGMIIGISCAVYLYLLNCKVIKHARELTLELEKLKEEKSKVNYFYCLLEEPNTINDLRVNTNKLIYLLYNFRKVNTNLDVIVREAIMDKIEKNNKKLKEIDNQLKR